MFFSRFKYNSLKWNFVELGKIDSLESDSVLYTIIATIECSGTNFGCFWNSFITDQLSKSENFFTRWRLHFYCLNLTITVHVNRTSSMRCQFRLRVDFGPQNQFKRKPRSASCGDCFVSAFPWLNWEFLLRWSVSEVWDEAPVSIPIWIPGPLISATDRSTRICAAWRWWRIQFSLVGLDIPMCVNSELNPWSNHLGTR